MEKKQVGRPKANGSGQLYGMRLHNCTLSSLEIKKLIEKGGKLFEPNDNEETIQEITLYLEENPEFVKILDKWELIQ